MHSAEGKFVRSVAASFRVPANHGTVTMTPDGDRFLVLEYPHAAGQTIHVLTNWHERIK
jgi:hypothetical protein